MTALPKVDLLPSGPQPRTEAAWSDGPRTGLDDDSMRVLEVIAAFAALAAAVLLSALR